MATQQPANPHRKNKIAEKQLAKRSQLWPDVSPDRLWNKKEKVGWTTIPRGLPYIMIIMDLLSKKGHPISTTYLDLWCRMHDESFVSLESKPSEMAYSSGFGGQRAIQTWRNRIDLLANLGFILFASGTGGPKSYALILNPYVVIREIKSKMPEQISTQHWNALSTRLIDIGADDLSSTPEVKSN